MCPVCRARFRGARECSRCGADLSVLMSLTVSAWRMRNAARAAVVAGEYTKAKELVARAQSICFAPAARRIELLSEWLSGSELPAAGC